MKRIGWAIALAAAAMSIPAAAAAPATAPAGQGAANASAPAAPALPAVAPSLEYGVPKPGGMGLQPQVTDVGREAASFHNNWLLVLCALISVFVLALLAYTMIRYRRGANPTPSRPRSNMAFRSPVAWACSRR